MALLSRPLTVQQLATKLGCSLDQAMVVVHRLRVRGAIFCLNPHARRSRLYARTNAALPVGVDWALYGWVCFSQRRAVLLALDAPRYPAAIKRRARYLHPGIRLSANNVRDIIRLFVARRIVRPIPARGRTYPDYELTPTGATLQRLLWEAQ